ncbi:uncharacterized protein PAC_06606 [Phialocephala subalpina]|uniref:Uncharacterized protein n=1 Tax=Phialocephala subalpina TaxID=576137 RepID=A0A1L7WVC5_9HELO|nr:uncharacterized protein PAC_06606 [Phialocephala subalpina]
MAAVVAPAAPAGGPQHLPNDVLLMIYQRQDAKPVIETYKCFARTRHLQLSINRFSRAQYIIRHPDTLRLNNSQSVVYFNRVTDAVYFDGLSFYNLWHYIRYHRPSLDRQTTLGGLQGFPNIQILGSYWLVGGTSNRAGLAHLRAAGQQVLTGLLRVRLLGDRGILPVGTGGPGIFGRTMATRIDMRSQAQLEEFAVCLLRGQERFRADQRVIIRAEKPRILPRVAIFYAVRATALGILEGP